MKLFNRNTLKRYIKPAPADHLASLDARADMIRSGRVYALKETALQSARSGLGGSMTLPIDCH
ncbi:hypothetical protein [Haematobacter massiliensis]|uniref:hypothetical protein n=1 Tax=Haematobacter massiliensis TaxID=195105 RepID=UPI00103CCBDC|nr:hypothetical protein [Haematobacter massiliensis]